jgi:hypothetical protein
MNNRNSVNILILLKVKKAHEGLCNKIIFDIRIILMSIVSQDPLIYS